jgi:UTP--glucose-1-phosphate uridylyltransferase
MIKKAILPVAGLGTRFLPASKAIPKEMITVVDKPVVQYVVEEAVAAGITEIVLVNHALKKAIEDHFDVNYELEAELEKKGKTAMLNMVRSIVPPGVRVVSVRQGRPLGLGHAVLCAREVIGNDPFAVLLPDVLVDDHGLTGGNDLSRMVRAWDQHQAAQIMVQQVPMSRVDQYGVVALRGDAPSAGQSVAMTGVVEKPKPEDAPSDLTVVGRYVLPARIFDLLATTAPGAAGEIQLTDGIAALIRQQPVEAYRMMGATYDCGSKIGYLEATLQYALRHPELGKPFRQLMDSIHSPRQ